MSGGGAAVYLANGSSPTIANCHFQENFASEGGAIYGENVLLFTLRDKI